MSFQVKVRAGMDTFYFLEPEREFIFDVRGGIRVVSQFLVIVETIVFSPEAESLMPAHAGFFPFLEPLQFRTGTYKELHLHLLELAHTENKLASHDFVAERFTDLSDTERNLHPSCFLNIQEVHENTLRGFRAQVNLAGTFCRGTHLGREHQVELAYFRPVAGTGYRAYNLVVDDNLTHFRQVVIVQRLCHSCREFLFFSDILQHLGICLAI